MDGAEWAVAAGCGGEVGSSGCCCCGGGCGGSAGFFGSGLCDGRGVFGDHVPREVAGRHGFGFGFGFVPRVGLMERENGITFGGEGGKLISAIRESLSGTCASLSGIRGSLSGICASLSGIAHWYPGGARPWQRPVLGCLQTDRRYVRSGSRCLRSGCGQWPRKAVRRAVR
ncbi:MAG UNVERIFIED_CONTAM: hypothetical protein LVR18_32380 [Planctomycetaceae bacterium]